MGGYRSVNPWTGESLASYAESTDSECQELLAESQKVQTEWARQTLDHRLRPLEQLLGLLKEQKEDCARMISSEMGKLITEAEAEVEKCMALCSYVLDHAPAVLEDEPIEHGLADVCVRKRPLGLLLGVMPWNFPFWQVFRFAVPNLILGNGILLKHASNVGGCSQLIESLMNAAGFPVGLYRNIFIAHQQVQRLLEDPRVSGLSFTGSESVGRHLASIAGKNLKKQVLELGGNNALCVLEDADVSKAVEMAIRARLLNAGQSCIAAKRMLIHESLFDAFLAELKNAMNDIEASDPLDRSSRLAPMVSEQEATLLERQVENVLKQGGQLVGSMDRNKACFSPCIVKHERWPTGAVEEELFGPVFSVSAFSNRDDLIHQVNSSSFGLGASLVGSDLFAMRSIAERLDEGGVFLNSPVFSDPRIPFGGVKNSGFGRELGQQAFTEFANIQPLVIFKEKGS